MDPQLGPAQQDPIIGQTIGNYLVTQKLGEGGMGSVYLAEHPTIGKKVALKILHAEFSSNEDVTKRFFHEAKAVNDIGHPNIVDIVDYGVIQAGEARLVYFIMEYLSGITLTGLLRQEAPMAPERAFAIALQVADALSASHKCGIVHRDLKPDNIMLQQRGRERDFVKLLDFGIAKLTTEGGVSKGRTQTGMVLGTPAYMSPEQCEGRGTVDHRTDVYALGIVLYEMLTGRVPFVGEGYGEILIQHLTRVPEPPSQYRMLNLHVEAAVMKALEKRPDLRYPNMEEFMRALADPVGYVEAHGGLQGFLQRPIMPSTAPLPSMRFTPAPGFHSSPGMQPTPPPGYMRTPVPGTPSQFGGATPGPTTLGGATGEVAPRRSKAGFFIAGTLVIAAAAVGIVVVTSGSKKETPVVAAGSGSDTGGSAIALKPIDPAGSGSATAPDPNGSAVEPKGSGSAELGSAKDPGSGSAVPDQPKPEVAKIVLRTKPEGAKIFVNGTELAQRTPAPFLLPYSKAPVKVVLKLDKHEDLSIPLTVKGDIDQEYTLKKKRSGQVVIPRGSNAGSGKGSNKGNDTGLMRPDDL